MWGAMEWLSSELGVSVDLLKTFIALITSLLLSPVYRFVGRSGKNWLSIIVGCAFLFFMIEEWALFILGSAALPFFLFGRISRPFLASAICSFFMLLVVHGYRFVKIYSVWRVDCSVYVMLLVTKLTYYARWLEKQKGETVSFIDYMAYHLFFPGVIVGPTFSFEVYLGFINNRFQNSLKSIKVGSALQPLLICLPLACLAIVSLPHFHSRWVLENQFYLSLGLISKILIMNIVGFFYRLKYYVGWYFGQAATNLSGLSLDSNGLYSTVCAVSLKFETELNPRNKTEHWNASMQLWLKDVVYEGLKEGGGERVAFLGTFIVSAYWHGLYLTYYLGFFYWGMLLHINKWIYKWSLAFPKLSASLFLKAAAFLISSSLFNYIGMMLAILNWDDAVAFHSGVNHWGTFLLFTLFAASFLVVPRRRKQNQEERKQSKKE